MKLTDKQKKFCREYPVDLNATQAAVRAGYSKKTARQIGAQNLSKLDIQAEIAKKQKKAAVRAEVKAADVLRELKRLGFSRITDYVSFGPDGVEIKDSAELSEDEVAAIAEVTESTTTSEKSDHTSRRFRLHSKTRALEMLGRHLDLFAEKDQAAVINVHVHNH